MSTTSLSIDALERAVAAFPDDALSAARKAALSTVRKRGLPTQRDEDWKYTNLSNVIDISERWLTRAATTADEPVDETRVRQLQQSLDAAWLVIANGRVLRHLSPGFDETGINIGPLDSTSLINPTDVPLSSLNTALLTEGLMVSIGSDRAAHRPIGLLIIDTAEASAVASQAQIHIEMRDNSAARFVEYHISAGNEEHYSNTLINLDVSKGAHVDYLRLQDRAPHHSQTQRLNVGLDEGSAIQHCGIDLGGRLTRNDLHIDINGADAAARFDGLYIAGEGQHIDNHTRVDHRVGPAVSSQEYRGILAARCRAVWNGKAIVHKGADGSDAEQANHNLLLSEDAEINAKPELEIYADEVKCAHGTTVGQLDNAALFYLRSRGLDKPHAKRVLTRAFAASVVGNAAIPEYREQIAKLVEQRLTDLANRSTS